MAQFQYHIAATTAERNLLKKEIRNMFVGNDDIHGYKDFFGWMGKPEMFKMRKNRTLECSDLVPLAYRHIAMDGNNKPNQVKLLLIDEMQDYSPIQYRVLQKLYPCRKTVLGDASQSVNSYGSSTADMIQKALVNGAMMKLCKSYRSTFEITDFVQKIRRNEELEPVARHGEKPQILKFTDETEEMKAIDGLIDTYKKSDYKSLGIICKTESQAKETAEQLKAYTDDIYFLSSQSTAFVQGIVITSAHTAKGTVITTHVHYDHFGGHFLFHDFYVHEAEVDWINGGFTLTTEHVRVFLTEKPCDFPTDFDVNNIYPFQGIPDSDSGRR